MVEMKSEKYCTQLKMGVEFFSSKIFNFKFPKKNKIVAALLQKQHIHYTVKNGMTL